MTDFNTPLLALNQLVERPWGGDRLVKIFNKHGLSSAKIGESWELSALPALSTTIANGTQEYTVKDFFINHRELLGSCQLTADGCFPILLKFIDARETLSVQLHPTRKSLAQLPPGTRQKNEAWYIIDAQPEAAIYLGLKGINSKDELNSAIENGQLIPHLNRIPVKAGELYYVPAGTVHAIGGGILLAEVQECSDTTYRLYDWGRLGLDGKPRQLHLAESLISCAYEPTVNEPQPAVLTEYFNIFIVEKSQLSLPAGELYMLMTVAGEITLADRENGRSFTYQRGQTVILPATARNWQLTTSAGRALLVTAGGVNLKI